MTCTCATQAKTSEVFRSGQRLRITCIVIDTVQVYEGTFVGENGNLWVIRKDSDKRAMGIAMNDIHNVEVVPRLRSRERIRPELG